MFLLDLVKKKHAFAKLNPFHDKFKKPFFPGVEI